MISEALEQAQIWFHDYVKTFLFSGSTPDLMIQHKVDHSLRVAGDSRMLAEKLQWHGSEIVTAELLGLLHDIGRFSQYARYGTFVDACSVNHGEHGYEVVRESTVLASMSPRQRQCILDGVRYHNCREIPQEINPESLPFVKLVRDADKLDIYRSFKDNLYNHQFKECLQTALKIRTEGPVNPDALNEVLSSRTVSDRNIKSQADYYLMHLSWVFDINYKPTFDHLSNSRILDTISLLLPDDEEIQNATDSVMNYVNIHAAG